MNNTFCLGIFLALIWLKDLTWKFSAETISILFIELIVGVISLNKVQTVAGAILILSLYVICIALVAVLESSYVGFD